MLSNECPSDDAAGACDSEIDEGGNADIDENSKKHEGGGRGHLMYRDEKRTHKYGLDKLLFVGGVFTIMQGVDTCLPPTTEVFRDIETGR